jgi:PAB-dependent poly(A)-specific ribonuclease subunit 2
VGPGLTSYTSWFAHVDEVRDILVHDRGVISLGSRNVRVTHRRGLQRWDIKHTFAVAVTDCRGNGIENLLCMAYSGTSHSEVVAAGGQNNILLLNIDRGTIVKQVCPSFGYGAESRNQRQSGIRNYDEGELSPAPR